MGKIILVVEDDIVISEILKARLQAEGYSVFVSDDGGEGIKLAEQKHPDLIFLDVMLPTTTGFEILHQLKSSPKTKLIPVIMLTSKVQEADVIRGLDLGAVDYIAKPFSLPELLLRIKRHIGSKQ